MATGSDDEPTTHLKRFLLALAAIGLAGSDTDQARQRKASLTLVASRLTVVAVIWAGLYTVAGFPIAAAALIVYAILTLLALVVFAATKSGAVFATTQYVLILVAPFAAAYGLGGLEWSSGIYLYALLSPLLALVVSPRWRWLWFAAFLALLVGAVAAEPFLAPEVRHDPAVERLFMVLNAAGLAWIMFASLSHFVRRGETSLAALAALFRLYVPADVGRVLMSDRAKTEMDGGAVSEVTALFADLGGFTSYGEDQPAGRVLELLNRYFELVAPIVQAEAGTLLQYQGDAFVAVWNATRPQSRHALAAARAALAIQSAIASIPDRDPRWPVFRIGLNTGPAVVGNVGSETFRSFTVIGDAINIASRLQAQAEPGQVLVSATTYALIRDVAVARSIGRIILRGRNEELEAFLVTGLERALR